MSFADTLKSLGPSRLAPIGLVMAGLLAFFFYMASRLSTPDMALLYNELDVKDSGQIISKLEGMNIPIQIKGDGTQIYVPGDQVAKLRMVLAQDGLPAGGSLGYEIFDKSDGLATSSFVQNINLVRALEGELSRTISSLAPVKSARVHLVLPQRELFSRNKQDPSASIVLQMRSGRLDRSQVAAIQHLVAAAVPGLKPSQISIIDDQGALLARGGDENSGASLSNTEEVRVSYERRISGEIESLLEKSVGPGKVRAEVTAEMDFDRVTLNSELYDPESRVVRSQNTVEESGSSQEGSTANNSVGAQNNLPGAEGASTQTSNNNKNNRTEETINYEISKTIKQQVKESGQVKKLSVAVLVDGTYTTDDKGVQTYQPRSEENLKQLETLVKTAIGFSEDRGDTVQVVNMQFVAPAAAGTDSTAAGEAGIMGFNNSQIMKLAETLVMGIVGILALLLVVRPMMNRLLEPVGTGGGGGTARISAGGGGGMPQLTGPDTSRAMEEIEVSNPELDEMISLRQIEGRIKASSLKRIGDIVEKHPEETLSIIRTWLYQGKKDRSED